MAVERVCPVVVAGMRIQAGARKMAPVMAVGVVRAKGRGGKDSRGISGFVALFKRNVGWPALWGGRIEEAYFWIGAATIYGTQAIYESLAGLIYLLGRLVGGVYGYGQCCGVPFADGAEDMVILISH